MGRAVLCSVSNVVQRFFLYGSAEGSGVSDSICVVYIADKLNHESSKMWRDKNAGLATI